MPRKKTTVPKGFAEKFARARGLTRTDAWESAVTGLGSGTPFGNTDMFGFTGTGSGFPVRDKLNTSNYYDPGNLPWPEALALYHNNALAAKIVEFKPKEMFRKGYGLRIPDTTPRGNNKYAGDSDQQLAEDTEEYGTRLKLNERFLEGWIWGRLFGGNLLLVGADDGRDPSEPLDTENIRSILFLNNVDKRFVYAHTYYADPMRPDFGMPATYMVTNTLDGPIGKTFGKNAILIIHESRVIRFDGSPVDIIKRRQLAGWTLSVLQRVYESLRQYDVSFQAAANLMTDAAQGVFKMKGVYEQIASGNVQDLQTRMGLVDMQRSAAKSLILDADGEDFERKQTPMAGIPDTMDRFMVQIAMAAEIPVNILFGRTASALNQTAGENDFRTFYDNIASEQNGWLKPQLLRLYKLILLAKDGPTGGKLPDKCDIKFEPLWQMTEGEQADIELKYGQRDVAYVNAGILLPEEVALSRFRKGNFDATTEIEVEPREQSLEASHDFNVQTAEAKAEAGPMIEVPDPHGQDENAALPEPGPGSGKPGETN